MLSTAYRREQGVTLIELMIGLLLGLIVTGIAISMYISTIGITRQTNDTVRLGNEMRSSLDLMVRDIRRAGYWAGANPASNPHASVVDSILPIAVLDDAGRVPSGDCLILSYDIDRGGQETNPEIIGFRRFESGDEQSIQAGMMNSASIIQECDDDTFDWQYLTDPRFTKVTDLIFTPIPSDVASFASASVRSIAISLTGEVVHDPKLVRQYETQVRVR